MFIAEKKATGGSLGKKLKSTHFVGTVDAGFAVLSELLKKLPAKGGFTSGRSCADDVETWTEELLVVNIVETGEPIRVIFKRVDVSFEVVSEIIGKV